MLGGRTTGAVIVFLTASKFFFLVCCLVFLPVPGLTGAAAVLSDVLESCPARVATSSILPDGVVAFSRRFFFLLAKMDFVDLIFFWVPIRLWLFCWCCPMFFLNTGPQRSVHLLHNSETPASVFALLEAAVSPSNPNGNKTVALVADNLFDLLMLKLSNFYQAKKQTKIESRGPRFEAGDFLVKLGSVTMGPAFKGILVEVCTPSIYLFSLSSLVSFVRYYLRIPSRPYFSSPFFISRSNPKWWTDMLRPLPIKTAGPGRPYKAGDWMWKEVENPLTFVLRRCSTWTPESSPRLSVRSFKMSFLSLSKYLQTVMGLFFSPV